MEPNQIRQFANLLQNDDPNFRRAAALFLGREKAEGVVGPLVKALRDKVWQVRQAAAIALGLVGKPAAFDSLLSRLGVKEAGARAAALEILAQSASPDPERDKGQKDPFGQGVVDAKDVEDSWPVRQALALALARVRPDLFEEPLLQALEAEMPNVKIAAMSGLASLGSAGSAEKILALCDHPDSHVQRAAVVALGKLRAPAAVPKLIELCESKHATIRAEAVIALNHLKEEQAFEALCGRLQDSDARVRMTAVLAVGNTRRGEAADLLVPMLNDSAPEVAAAACQAMVTLKAVDRAPAVAQLLLGESEETRNAAAQAYVRLVGA